MKIKHYSLLPLLLMALGSDAQGLVKGRVNDFTHDTLSFLSGATITNKNDHSSVLSDQYGYYTIRAKENDQLIFSHTGFISDTVTVQSQFFVSGYDAALIEEAAFLAGVTVISAYRRDSIRRRQAYAFAYEKQPGITGGNTPTAGVGIVLSPFSFFSKEKKETRRLKKQLEKQEEEAFIDYVFSPAWVSSLTRLKGPALQQFMIRYRPTYEFCRKHHDRAEMITYISDSYKEFQKTQP
ncbi:hypothetical protein ABDK00_012270 [Niabella insulamsoli]|uniref:hypothetical protein n=1 Tax=Niabella insulamsoli TaxID=3144874 RepID=UPI0031FE3722